MLPSNNSINGNHPIYSNYTDQTLLYHKPFNNDHLFSNVYHFPSPPFIHYETDNNDEFFLQQYQDLPLITTANTTNYIHTSVAETNVINNMVDSNINITTPPPKRSSKRDRHSKINTAQGPRDRRMRLSLEIAQEFFGLQDMLGYDKASKTVQWLLSKAKSDIKQLVAKSSGRQIQTIDSSSGFGAKSTSSTSECEVISGIDHQERAFTEKQPSKCVNKEKIRHREVRKAAFRPARARESREKARAKARERTKKKMCAKSKLFPEDETTNQESNQLGSSCSPLSMEVQLAEAEKWSPFTSISQEHQFAEIQFWESYNIQSLL